MVSMTATTRRQRACGVLWTIFPLHIMKRLRIQTTITKCIALLCTGGSCAFLVLPVLRAQQVPDGEALVKGTRGHFHTIQYTDQTTIEIPTPAGPVNMTVESSTAKVNPGKLREESTVQGMMTLLKISDGEVTTIYEPAKNEYVKIPAALGDLGVFQSMGLGAMPDTSKAKLSYRTLRDETVEVDGVKHDCRVVETQVGNIDMPEQNVQLQGKITMTFISWVDKDLNLPLQSNISMSTESAATPAVHMTMRLKNLKVDQSIPDSLFTFKPPPDAKEVKEMALSTGPKDELSGKDAPPFEVKGLDGTLFSLDSVKGKPVLLEFWTTWCGPCRMSMPVTEKLYREYMGQGLVVLAINAGEDRSVVEDFLKRNPMEIPAALGGESAILESYKVQAYPTFVLIGREGKVTAEEIGFGGEEVLRSMLAKAGLEPR